MASNSPRKFATLITLVGVVALCRPAFASPTAAPKLEYLRDIRPILAANCFPCHGMDDKKRLAGLRLDQRDSAYARSASGEIAIVPGSTSKSVLVKRITDTGGLKMPPEGSGKRLSPADIHTLKLWVAQGAVYARNWAFQKPVMPTVPNLKNDVWSRNEIDRFILARLRGAGLSPAPEADRCTLIRRLSLDLIGLPPTPEQVQAFVSDKSPRAYDNLVDRLLVSPHFGEKWARSWLDLARFADSAGYGSDPLRPNLWPYRDWVINALNKNMPYDEFVIEQIAGDLLPNPTQEQMIATAFHRNTMTNTEGGTDREEFRTAAIKDRASTTAQAIMGLTLGCAQCHSHKFDPITNKEYYRFVALFNQTADNDQPDERPTMPVLSEIQKGRQDALKAEIEQLQKTTPTTPELKIEIDKKQKLLAEFKPINLPVMQELPKDKRRQSYVLVLGKFLNRGDKVDPGVPAAFAGNKPITDRLDLARWLVSDDNPLTARVAVNRIWAQLFGTGIVETEEDFGQQGALPSNQPLLDWLAFSFQHSEAFVTMPPTTYSVGRVRVDNWGVKSTIRTIVTSSAYRQSSSVSPLALEKDPRNRLISRYPRRRLTAENVRDQALALSGLLSDKIGGPSVFPPQPGGLWQAAFNGDRTYPTSTGEERYRRGLYTFWRRTVPPPGMAAFDAPSREICTFRRMPTNTPLQALVTLNDPIYVEMAQAMGRRLVKDGGPTEESRVRYGLQLALGRPPGQEQVNTLIVLFDKERARCQGEPDRGLEAGNRSPGANANRLAACRYGRLDHCVQRSVKYGLCTYYPLIGIKFMKPEDYAIRAMTRRTFFGNAGLGLGAVALGSLFENEAAAQTLPKSYAAQMAPKPPMHHATAKSVIYLHMSGAPPTLDMFDYKPELVKLNMKPCPDALMKGERFAFIKGVPNMLGTPYKFKQYGKSGAWVSETLPNTAGIVDDITLIRSMNTDQFNHAPAELFLYTGNAIAGNASMGSWITYGLGSMNQDLPGFVVLVSGGTDPTGGKSLWSSGFLPSVYQGVQCRTTGDPILYLNDPNGMKREMRRDSLTALDHLNELESKQYGDPETLTRISQYELAYRMQISVPEVMDISKEPQKMLDMYGAKPGRGSFANNCLLARRLVEKGVRFVQLYDWGWDIHGTGAGDDLMTAFPGKCKEMDQPAAALIRDLKQRGLLDQTLVVWGGEFGRTPMNEARGGSKFLGRDHHPHCFTAWMAGGGIKPGVVYGETDEFGYKIVRDKITIRDLQATILHAMGMDPYRFSYKYQGLNNRLIGPSDEAVVKKELFV